MNSVLAFVLLSGVILSVDSACDINACAKPASQTCTTVTTYLTCLTKEVGGCSGTTGAALKPVIDTAVKSMETAKATLCSGAMTTVSISTLILSLLVFYLKP